MASIRKRPDGKWRARYRDVAGKEHARHFARKVDAQHWLDEVTASLVRGDYVDPGAGKETLQHHAEAWAAMQPLRASTRYSYASDLRRHIYPQFGGRPLDSIGPSEVQAWVSLLPLAPSTAGRVHAILFSLMADAVMNKKIKVNPCASTKLPKDESRRVIPMTTEQTVMVRDALPEHMKAMVTLGAGTGMRQSEVFGLTVDRIDFLRRRVTVDRQLLTVPGRGPSYGPPKTKASVRSIPLPQVVVDALAAHLKAFPAMEAGEFAGLVFRHDWEPWTRQRFGHIWRPVAKAGGLPARTGFHALRHYYASLLIRHGESVKTVQARLGHASAAETLDTYSHLWPDSEDRTRDAVDLVLLGLADQVRTRNAPN